MKSKLMSMVLALLASVCLWIYVVTVVNQEVSNQPIDGIPVTFYGADQIRADSNLVITEGADATVNLRVTCSRQTLTELSSNNITITVDVSRIDKPGEYTLPYSISYPTGVSNSDVVASGSPQNITFTVERYTSKSVPVRGVLSGSVAEGYYASAMELNPSELLLEGPESVVNQVSYAQVILDQQDLTETVIQACPFTLIDENGDPVEADGITASSNGVVVDAIEVRQPVLRMKGVPLAVEFIDGGGLTGSDVTWTCEPDTITVAGEPEVLETVNQITVKQYDLSAVTGTISEDLPVTMPNGLVNVTELESVHVNVSINSGRIATKNVRVTEFVTVNDRDGYTANVMTVQITVTLRGPIDAVEAITEDDVRAVIDVNDLHEGTQSVPVTIEVTGSDSVAAVGEYTAAVSLTQD